MTHDPGPVTIGDLRRDGKALEVGCLNCDRHGYFDPHALALSVRLTADRLRCNRCGFRNTATSVKVWVRPDAWPPNGSISVGDGHANNLEERSGCNHVKTDRREA